MTSADTSAPGLPRGQARPVNRGLPPPSERERLRVTVGAMLRHERGRLRWSVDVLAEAAGMHPRSLERIETGFRRPSRTMCYKVAKALREGADDLAVAALAERLADAAGPSLRDYSHRPHRRRARLAAAVRGEAGGAVPASMADDMGALVLAELARRTAPPR